MASKRGEDMSKVKVESKKKKTSADYRDIGIDANPPQERCNDPHCPWHGHAKIRGRIFEGVVVSTKMQRSVVVQWDYIKKVRKYKRYMRARTKITAHLPDCIKVKEGDKVRIGETKPISKTKAFVVFEVLPIK